MTEDKNQNMEQRVVETEEGIRLTCKTKRKTDDGGYDMVSLREYYDTLEELEENNQQILTAVENTINGLNQIDVSNDKSINFDSITK